MGIQIAFISGVLLIVVSILLVFSFFVDLLKKPSTSKEKEMPSTAPHFNDYLEQETSMLDIFKEAQKETSKEILKETSKEDMKKPSSEISHPISKQEVKTQSLNTIQTLTSQPTAVSSKSPLSTSKMKDRIAELYQKGLSSEAIASELHISENQVRMIMNLHQITRSNF